MQIAGDVVTDLRAQSAALKARHLDEKTVGAKGAWLAGLQAQIQSAAGGAIVVPAYRVEQIGLTLQAGIGQAPPTIVTTLTGMVTSSTYTGSPARRVSTSAPKHFTRTVDVSLVNGRFVIVARPHDEGSRHDAGRARHQAIRRAPPPSPSVQLTDVAKAGRA